MDSREDDKKGFIANFSNRCIIHLETYRQTGDLGDTTRKMLSTKKRKDEGRLY